MIQLIKNNQKYLENKKALIKNKSLTKKIIEKLNKDKLVIISGLRGVGKINIISNLIKKSNYKNNYFYFNKEIDYNNLIKSLEDLQSLFSTYTKRYNKPSIIILENSHHIDGFKEFLDDLYSENKYKIIIIGNDIKISEKSKINVFPTKIKHLINFNKETNNSNLKEILNYGNLKDIFLLGSSYLKQQYINLTKSDIVFNDIIKSYGLKSYDLYNYVISYLSLFDSYTSLRELNKYINKSINLSLVTMIEYIDYSIESRLISRMYKYDLKKKKEITSKAKYYFTDTGIRNSFNGWSTDSSSLKENLIYNELSKKGYKINGGINGKFEFSFIGKKIDSDSTKTKIKNLHIHISKQTNREELKKEVRKLLKIKFVPTKIDGTNITETVSKYLIVDNISKMKLKKLVYENVEIIEFGKFIKKLLA